MVRKIALFLGSLVLVLNASAQKHPHASRSFKIQPSAEALYYADVYAEHYEVPKALVRAIITVESGWNRLAVSRCGAMGLMQLMPENVIKYGVRDPFSVKENIAGGVRLLHDLMTRYDDLRLVVAAYNADPRYLNKRGLNYANPDVTGYVRAVQRCYENELKRLEQ